MMSQNAGSAEPLDHGVGLPDPHTLLTGTNWAELEHALGPAFDLQAGLGRFMDDDIAVRSEAVGEYLELVNHQNSIYTATTPVALYVAALLPDPRTDVLKLASGRGGQPVPIRAALMDWLGGIADDVNDEVLKIARRHGFCFDGESPTMELRAVRPRLFRAVAAFVNDPQPEIRHAAVTAALLLLDAPDERRRYQDAFTPMVLDILATSANDYYRLRVLDSLDAWGEDTSALRLEAPASHDPHQRYPWAG